MFKKLERSMGFHPRHLGSPPQCDNPREGNNSTITLRRGGLGGQALSPPSKHVSFLFCAMITGILQSQKKDRLFFLFATRRTETPVNTDYPAAF
jgi:hypothetical protein